MLRFLRRPWVVSAAVAGAALLGAATPDTEAGVTAGLRPTPSGHNNDEHIQSKSHSGDAHLVADFSKTSVAPRRFDVSGSSETPAALDREPGFGPVRRAGRIFPMLLSPNNSYDDDAAVRINRLDAAAEDGQSTYLLCWEDKLARRTDRGASDLVIEIRVVHPSTLSSAPAPAPASMWDGDGAVAAATSEPLLIPLPPAVWSGLGGLLGLGAIGAYRRITHRPKW